MGRGKASVRKISLVSQDETETLNKMFGQMTGMTNAELDVLIPKATELHEKLIKYYKLFKVIPEFKEFIDLFQDYPGWFSDITEFLDKLVKSTEIDTTMKKEAIYNKFIQFDEDKLNKLWQK